MDETEKYQQRLEAIAEKRRQQEEQDRTRRELEDEKIRLQQLKRKSLRDQWLMEGAPLSPASPDPQSPRSPLWGSPTHESENHINTLQSKSLQLDEEKEEQMEDASQAEAVTVAEAAAEMVRGVVVKNGENNATEFETSEDEVNKSPRLDGAAVGLTNGEGHFSVDTNQNSNGPVDAAEGVVSMKSEPAWSLCVSESEPGHVPNVNINEEEEEEEEEEGILVIRAECVIITDEGEDAPEDVRPQEDEQETPLPDQEGESMEEVTTPETFTQPDKSQTSEPTAEAQPDTGDGDVDGDIKTNENINGSESEDPTCVQLQSPATYIEGATVALVPVYSEMHPSTVTPRVEVETAALSPEGAQDPATACGQFQEVPLADPLADPQVNQRTEAGQGKQEQEPLLSQVAAPYTQADPAAVAKSPANSETHSPTRASPGEETVAPKRKTCQCCSVM
ncbi:paralemmin-3 isoform X2 [Hippoglossus stenolepis]|uniref:paralemmin-3 isoform X2 n=1 Tax=Hippoglossus stenolepis TaxID=195615 RepID=UPI001FAFDDEE|nr:paralemmin-3 isoform X2 [Hippoglossus stenolepis]